MLTQGEWVTMSGMPEVVLLFISESPACRYSSTHVLLNPFAFVFFAKKIERGKKKKRKQN